MKSFYLTDAGRVRSHNEDSVTILKNKSGEYILMVADGMGGHRAGEVASNLAVTHFGERFSSLSSMGSKLEAVTWINDNAIEVNNKILEYANKFPEATGLGTTLVLAILTKEYLIFGNIGDSTGYVLKKGGMHQVTKPHTLVSLLVETGQLSEEDAKFHPKKNVLMKALGAMEKIEMDIFDVDLSSEAILLCSDGLTNMLSNDQIEKVLNDNTLDIEEKVKKLIQKCNVRGGQDNTSIAYLEIKESGEEK